MEPITETTKPRNWTRRKINAELKARGIKQSDMVRQTGRSKGMVSEVVAGRRKSQPIADAIAAALGRTPWEIWPRLYVEPSPSSAPPSAAPTPEPIPHAC